MAKMGMNDSPGMSDMHMPMPMTTNTPNDTGMDGMGDMGMKMYFHIGYETHVLFEKWVVQSDGAMVGTCIFFFVLAILYELLKHYRQLHITRAQSSVTVSVSEDNGTASNSNTTPESHIVDNRELTVRPALHMLSTAHLTQTGLHVIQMFVSYVLMLAFMLFNVWICLAVILGSGLGYFLVGYRRTQSYSGFEDHCH